MHRVPPDRAWWPAVGAPLERGVKHQRAKLRTRRIQVGRRDQWGMPCTNSVSDGGILDLEASPPRVIKAQLAL